ncbi:uncharacterized protein BDZ99DRAFT_286930 [Mytilinidion resinicola]|uniref:Ankyrin n=1 Tax=Mytilinidion resinicola TaxID=574789 RepID=A0A6A6YPH7_9PEZI|nr:uncharacterized protein BDZ99DRAFT_286930 [Mytilinidion resinicola]KAF2810680.1 hypothetical protein BDZ99DRAFT_286930 [Mytilinidion resinicola]
MKLLIKRNSDFFGMPILGNKEKQTCLHIAIRRNEGKCVEWLLDNMKIEHIQQTNLYGETGWEAACGLGSISFKVASAFVLAEENNQSFHADCLWDKLELFGTVTTYSFWLSNIPGLLVGVIGPTCFWPENMLEDLISIQGFTRNSSER